MFLKEHLNLTKSEVSKRVEYGEEKVEDGAKREKSLGPLRAFHSAAYYDH